MNTNPLNSDSCRWTLSAEELARHLGVSKRHVSAMNSAGKLPAPIRFGRSVRWLADEIREWLAAGAPHRDRWETMKSGGRR